MEILTLSRIAARRFILGRQGLWPGRRWKGRRGVECAMRTFQAMSQNNMHALQAGLAAVEGMALHIGNSLAKMNACRSGHDLEFQTAAGLGADRVIAVAFGRGPRT